MAAEGRIPKLPAKYTIPNGRDFPEQKSNTFPCIIHLNGVFRGELDKSPTRIYPAVSSLLFTFGVRVVDEATHQDVLIHADGTESIGVDYIQGETEPHRMAAIFKELGKPTDPSYKHVYIFNVHLKKDVSAARFISPKAPFEFRSHLHRTIIDDLRNARIFRIFVAVKTARGALMALNRMRELLTETRFLARGGVPRDDWFFSRQEGYVAQESLTARFQNFIGTELALHKPEWLKLPDTPPGGPASYGPWLGRPSGHMIEEQGEIRCLLSRAAYVSVCIPAILWAAEYERQVVSSTTGVKSMLFYERRIRSVIECVQFSPVPPPVGGTYVSRLSGPSSITREFTMEGVAFGEPAVGKRMSIWEMFLEMPQSATLSPADRTSLRRQIFEDTPNTLFSLDDSQKRAYIHAISNAPNALAVIAGSPGTGKSMVLALIAYAIMRLGMKALVCALTSEAVNSTMSHLIFVTRRACNLGYCGHEVIGKLCRVEQGRLFDAQGNTLGAAMPSATVNRAVLQEMLVVGAVVDSVDALPFEADSVLVDDATQLSEVDICVPLGRQLRPRTDESKLLLTILAGDETQLGPSYHGQDMVTGGPQHNPLAVMLATSAMRRWPFANPTLKVHRLAYNYRQDPDLYRWTNEVGLSNSITPLNRVSRDGRLRQEVEEFICDPNNQVVFGGPSISQPGAALRRQLFLNVDSPHKGVAAKCFNPGGVHVIAKIVQQLVVGHRIRPSDIGVVTFAETDAVQLLEAIHHFVNEMVEKNRVINPRYELYGGSINDLLVNTVLCFKGERQIMIVHIPLRGTGTLPWGNPADQPAKLKLACERACEYAFWVGPFQFYMDRISMELVADYHPRDGMSSLVKYAYREGLVSNVDPNIWMPWAEKVYDVVEEA